MRLRTAVAGFLAFVALAGCAPTVQESLPGGADGVSASQASKPAQPSCNHEIKGKAATCATILKTEFDPADFLPSFFSMSVKLEDGTVKTIKTPDPSSAEDLHLMLSPGNKIAYVLNDGGYLESDGVKVL